MSCVAFAIVENHNAFNTLRIEQEQMQHSLTEIVSYSSTS